MNRTLLAAFALACLLGTARADDAKPQFPKAPVGFDDGRAVLTEELLTSSANAAELTARVFEDAGLPELAQFIASHLLGDELSELDSLLQLKGDLTGQSDPKAICQLLESRKVSAAGVIAALGKLLLKRGYNLSHAAAWFYQRDVNSIALAAALGRQTHGARAVRAELVTMQAQGKGLDAVFEKAFWEFDLRDSTRVAGGHYDNLQLIESLLDLEVDSSIWADALGLKNPAALSAHVRKLISWGDAALLASVLEGRSSERDLVNAALTSLRKQERAGTLSLRVVEQAKRRSFLGQRWFRTAGRGVIGVYKGPWHSARSAGVAATIVAVGDKTGEEFAAGVSEEMQTYFSKQTDSLTLVLYEDGSARASLSLEDKSKLVYTPDTPLGSRETSLMLFEGRASLSGKIGLLTLVFAGKNKPAVLEIELAGLALTKNKAFLTCEVEVDGGKSKPLLLRHVSRNIALE